MTKTIAYFSMEIGIDPVLPTYSGGLGVLAGDTLRAAADMGLPVVAVTLLYRKGYFRQHLDVQGSQSESPVTWSPEDHLVPVPAVATVQIEDRPVRIRAWKYTVRGQRGHIVPIYFLDTALPENAPEDQHLTDTLYGGDEHYRLRQEVVLGMGGVEILKQLGLPPVDDVTVDANAVGIDTYHMNEGHAALLTLLLLAQRAGKGPVTEAHRAWVRERCVFTTHTPVAAGHDTFPVGLAETVLGKALVKAATELGACPAGRLNMSELAIHLSRYVNGVAKRHAEVSRKMFPGVRVEAVTNGVHALSWTADAIRTLFDKHLSGWREDNNYLRYACELPLAELMAAHRQAKAALFREIQERTGVVLDPGVFTLGFARRAAEYKRADLLFHNPGRLRELALRHPLQIVYGGKAHPRDLGGKRLIERVFEGARDLAEVGANIKVVYLENYDMTLGRLITAGVDLWLNNPVKPLEASGTSGMKAAINGVPSLSTLDGWWVEGCINNVTGWEIEDPTDAFGGVPDDGTFRDVAAESLYGLLGGTIIPGFYSEPLWYAEIMRNAIFVNGSYFNTHRMVLQYLTQAYTRRTD